MTNYATKMMDWGDPIIGYQQQRGQHGEGVTVTHNLVRLIPAADGALEINFGSTVYFCGGAVVQRSDGEILLSADQRRELGRVLVGVELTAAGVTLREAPKLGLLAADAQRNVEAIAEGILSQSRDARFRSGVKIAAGEIIDRLVRAFVKQGYGAKNGQPEREKESHSEFDAAIEDLSRKLAERDTLLDFLKEMPDPDAVGERELRAWARVLHRTVKGAAL